MEEDIHVEEKIGIFSSDDLKLKFLGEILSNESSRTILILIANQEMSANDIAEKTDIRLSLVIHHLNKMLQTGIVKISNIRKNTKNHDVKYYSAKLGILILPQNVTHKAKKSKTLSNALKRVLRVAAVGVAGIFAWMITEPNKIISDPNSIADSTNANQSVIIGLIIVIAILSMELFVLLKRKKEK